MDIEQPILIFVTSKECKVCNDFKGQDGRPSDEKPWCNSLIREYLTGSKYGNNNKKSLCSKLIEITDYRIGPYIENIGEFNIHVMIPDDLTLHDDILYDILADDNKIFGDSVLRISIKKLINSEIDITVEIDSNDQDRRCEYLTELCYEYFIWSKIPIDFENMRKHFNNKKSKSFDLCCTNIIVNDPIHKSICENYKMYENDPSEFDILLKRRFNYLWFLNKFYPSKLRELEPQHYPSWIFVLPSVWQNGVNNNSVVFGKVKNCTTKLVGERYKSVLSSQETIQDIIKQYYSGRLPLTYEGYLLKTKNKYNKNFVDSNGKIKDMS